MKAVFINGTACISPQPIFEGKEFLQQISAPQNHRLVCAEPDYSAFFEAKNLRRMGRLLKFGTAAGLLALRRAGIEKPDAINTGTGLGLLEDSGRFLKSVIDAHEDTVSPTAFIQSTHNTVSSNISVITGCHAHNFTFSQKGLSFETALLDSILLLDENEGMQNILTGAYDELTDYSFAIMQRLGVFRHTEAAGEGAAYFLLGKTRTETTSAVLYGMETIHDPQNESEVELQLQHFLKEHQIETVDLVIDGSAVPFVSLENIPSVPFKKYCGEFMTASAFGLWLGVQILSQQHIPEVLHVSAKKLDRILILNQYKKDHSFMLIGR
ncbi:MAG: beta-ketoacyl synthase chain length factor [Chitinophagales bacterium]